MFEKLPGVDLPDMAVGPENASDEEAAASLSRSLATIGCVNAYKIEARRGN